MNPTPKFQRKIEDFICKHCGLRVKGNGYTNHCPECLWSRHIDVNPGDRMERCRGMMEPIRLEKKGDEYSITHRCVKCGLERKNKTSELDNSEALLKL